MKKSFLSIATALILLVGSCSSSSDKKTDAKSEPAASELKKEVKDSGEDNEQFAKHLTKEDFLAKVMNYEKNTKEWVFEGDKPCIIDFYADWCAPCRITSPILEELAMEYDGKIDVYKIDIEEERELAAVFGIQGIPFFLFVPMEGKPTPSQGIPGTPEDTKKMFRNNIDQLLLKPLQEKSGRP